MIITMNQDHTAKIFLSFPLSVTVFGARTHRKLPTCTMLREKQIFFKKTQPRKKWQEYVEYKPETLPVGDISEVFSDSRIIR